MDNELTFRAEKFLSAAIFVLWSVGVVIIPSIKNFLGVESLINVERLYLAFQIILFVFAVYLLCTLAKIVLSGKKRKYVVWRAALYIYVVVSLFWSIALTARALPY